MMDRERLEHCPGCDFTMIIEDYDDIVNGITRRIFKWLCPECGYTREIPPPKCDCTDCCCDKE